MLYEVADTSPKCPICKTRVSAWMIAGGRSITVGKETFHKNCLIDYKLRTGKDYVEK